MTILSGLAVLFLAVTLGVLISEVATRIRRSLTK